VPISRSLVSRRLPAVLLAAVSLLTTACGSTVQSAGSNNLGAGAPAGAAVDGLGGTGAAGTDGLGGVGPVGTGIGGPAGGLVGDGSAVTTGSAGTGGASDGGVAVAGGGQTGAGNAGGRSVENAPGVTATELFVGVVYFPSSDEAIKAFGFEGATSGDQKAEAQIIIDDINKRGGILGRKVRPVFVSAQRSPGLTADQQAAEICTELTEDNNVFAVVNYGGVDSFKQCINKAGAVHVYENIADVGTATYRRYPYYIQPGDLGFDRLASAETPSLLRHKYFAPWNPDAGAPGTGAAKVGILTYDSPEENNAVDRHLLPGLKAAGHRVDPANILRISDAASEMQGAVLKFKSNKVTHVIIFEQDGGLFVFFLQSADKQQYRPRYGLQSGSGAQLFISLGAVPTSQLNGAVGFGWIPLLDISDASNPDDGPYSNSARRGCVTLMRSNNQRLPDANAKRHAINLCDSLYLIERALKLAGGPSITRDSFLGGVHGLGTSFINGQTFQTKLTPTQHDGVATVRQFTYQTKCTCMAYTSNPFPIP